MTVLAGLMAWMVVMLARHLLYALVSMPLWIEVARGMTRMIVMLAGHLFDALVPMTLGVEIAGRMARMVVMRTRFLLCHVVTLPLRDRCRRRGVILWFGGRGSPGSISTPNESATSSSS